MAEGAILDPPESVADPTPAEGAPGTEEVPSVFAVTNRYLVGRAEVTPPLQDGSRIIRLHSASGGAVIEANLAPQLCEFVAAKLVEIEVIEEDDTDASGT